MVVAVSLDGTAVAVAPGADSVLAVRPGAEPLTSPVPGGPLSLGGLDPGSALQVTTVGATPVLLDGGDGTLRLPAGRVALPDPVGRRAAAAGPGSRRRRGRTPRAVLSVGLADGAVTALAELPAAIAGRGRTGGPEATASTPAGPGRAWPSARAARRAHRARRAAPSPSRRSSSAAPPWCSPITARGGRGSPTPATARSTTGRTSPRPTRRSTTPATVDDPTTNSDLPRLPPDCTAVPIGAPSAADDEFGVRADRATVLRVLDNDPSVDCTSVVISAVSPLSPEVRTRWPSSPGAAPSR